MGNCFCRCSLCDDSLCLCFQFAEFQTSNPDMLPRDNKWAESLIILNYFCYFTSKIEENEIFI